MGSGHDPDLENYGDEAYFEDEASEVVFNSALLRESTRVLPARKPLIFGPEDTVTDAIRSMQGEHRGCVLVTQDGTPASKVVGIFTERDVLFRIVDRGRNPAMLPLRDVMTPDPERLRVDRPIAAVLHLMNVGGFRHIPVVEADDSPAFVVSVRDVVEFMVEAFPREILNFAGFVATPKGGPREGA